MVLEDNELVVDNTGRVEVSIVAVDVDDVLNDGSVLDSDSAWMETYRQSIQKQIKTNTINLGHYRSYSYFQDLKKNENY